MSGEHSGMGKPKSDRYLIEPEFLSSEGPFNQRFTNCATDTDGDTKDSNMTHESQI